MSEKNQFDFKVDPVSDIDLDEELAEEKDKSKSSRKEEARLSKRERRKRYLVSALIMFIATSILIALLLIWQDSFDLLAWTNALTVTLVLKLAAAWMLFVYNLNILSPVMYGYKAFFKMFIGKKQKVSYHEYMQNINDNPIPSYYIVVILISSFILFIPSLITFLMVL